METPGAPRLDKVRHALKKMEAKRNEFLFEKHAIGRVSSRRRDIVKELASISNRKVPFKWQRGNKIGKIEILSVIHFSGSCKRDLGTDRQEGPAPNSKVSSLVLRPVRTIRVSGGGLETSAIVTSLPSDVIS